MATRQQLMLDFFNCFGGAFLSISYRNSLIYLTPQLIHLLTNFIYHSQYNIGCTECLRKELMCNLMIQPANKEKIELLGEWLRYAIHQNDCEDYDGRFADVGSAFILHSIAFLEVVRQVWKDISAAYKVCFFPHISVVRQNISCEHCHSPKCRKTSSGYEVHCRDLLVSDIDLNVDDSIILINAWIFFLVYMFSDEPGAPPMWREGRYAAPCVAADSTSFQSGLFL